jgi:hypothetical protein
VDIVASALRRTDWFYERRALFTPGSSPVVVPHNFKQTAHAAHIRDTSAQDDGMDYTWDDDDRQGVSAVSPEAFAASQTLAAMLSASFHGKSPITAAEWASIGKRGLLAIQAEIESALGQIDQRVDVSLEALRFFLRVNCVVPNSFTIIAGTGQHPTGKQQAS